MQKETNRRYKTRPGHAEISRLIAWVRVLGLTVCKEEPQVRKEECSLSG
jgi:hypothetical protein